MNLQSFVASPFWLTNFKRRHHITSRKVTKLVVKNYIEDRQKVINEENILQIPPKTKADIQLCVKYFFRQWTYFYQKRFDRVVIDRLKINLRLRNNILKLHSIIHNQLSSNRFISMIKYA
jgi:hypothetical protein